VLYRHRPDCADLMRCARRSGRWLRASAAALVRRGRRALQPRVCTAVRTVLRPCSSASSMCARRSAPPLAPLTVCPLALASSPGLLLPSSLPLSLSPLADLPSQPSLQLSLWCPVGFSTLPWHHTPPLAPSPHS
jgi:hypothetical protein